MKRRMMAVAFVLGSAALAGAQASTATGQPDQAAGSGVSLEELGKLECFPGLERFLPGVYYYCVGARDLANHRDASGVEMLKLAATWGSKPAQFTLGVGYFKGDIVAQDRPRGLAWLGLARERHDPSYQAVLRSAWEQASPAEQAKANALWKEMLPTYGDARAARRAERRFRNERAQLLDGATSGRRTCIAGLTSRTIAPLPSPKISQPLSSLQLSSGCPGGMEATTVIHRLDSYAGRLFDGLEGQVTVGPLLPVASPARQDGGKR